MRPRILVYILVGLLCHSYSFSQERKFTLVEPPKETPWSAVYGIAQDRQGYLWLATGGGLYKYDGTNYTFYKHEPGNPNSLGINTLEHVYADNDGIIWIATFGGGMDRLDPETGIFTHFRHNANDKGSLLDDRVSCIIKDRDGMLWIGTNSGLEKFDPKTRRFTHFIHNDKDAASLSNNQVRVIYEDSKGTIWIGTGSPNLAETPAGEGGLNKLNKKTGKFTRYLHDAADPNSLTDSRVQTVFEGSRGTFWVGTAGDGLHIMNRATGLFKRYPYDAAHPEKLSGPPLSQVMTAWDDHITFINEDNSGKIWIGSFGNGVNVYDPSTQKVTHYGDDPNSREKINSTAWRGYQTRDGIFWLTTWGTALYKVNPYQHNIPYVHLGKHIFNIMEDTAGTLWLATGNGLVHRQANNRQQVFNTSSKGSSGQSIFTCIAKADDNTFWLATFTGLYRFAPSTGLFTDHYHHTGSLNSLVSDTVFFIKKGRENTLWVGTNKGLDLMDINTRAFKHFTNNKKDSASISNNNINVIQTDRYDNPWVGTSNGLNKLDEKTGRFKRYLGEATIFDLLNDSRGNFWACTLNGLYKYDHHKDLFSMMDLGTIFFAGAAEDHQKNLWFSTTKGVIRLNLRNNETNIYGKNQGINVAVFSSLGYTRRNGDILFSDTGGYYTFQPEKLLHSIPAPTVVINGFLLDDVPIAPAKGGVLPGSIFHTNSISLQHNQGTFSFSFSIIDFAGGPGDDHSFYMLENYDNKWRKASAGEAANYHNVAPGRYIFKVKSVNINGLVTEKHIVVIILPPWWQTWWACTLFVLALAASLWGFIYFRSLSLLKEKRILEHKVHIRTEEVLQQKEEIEAQRDNLEKAFGELKNAQTQLIQSEKMASLGELTAGIAHEIQNPLNFVNNFSEVNKELLEELKAESEKPKAERDEALESELINDLIENEQKINHHGKRADGIVKGMLQHSRTAGGEKLPTNINSVAEEYLRLSYHGLRAKDKNFNAEMVMHFDPDLPKIQAVGQDIGRVLLNLFNNAFYAVNQKKKTAPAGYNPEVSVTTSTENGQVIIKVKDNGVGMPEHVKEKIMQPFFTTKPTGEGTGLGLSLTYDMVVKGHGGSIEVNSVEGEGSEFMVTLPI
jgi:signal transduction histidine kinase/ligand-binding sensor domain-containing protein